MCYFVRAKRSATGVELKLAETKKKTVFLNTPSKQVLLSECLATEVANSRDVH